MHSWRVPAGLNNIVGSSPASGLISARGVVPAAQSVDCVSIFARTVGLAAQVLEAAMGHDALDPYSRKLQHGRSTVPRGLSLWCADRADLLLAMPPPKPHSARPSRGCALGGTPVTVDFTPLARPPRCSMRARWWPSATPPSAPSSMRMKAEVMEPVRSIIASRPRLQRGRPVDAQTQLRALGQQAATMWGDIDVLLVPTAPTHYTIAAMQADPVALNRNLGAYTNFVNLLDYAALSVPSSIRADGLPFGITLIGPCGSDWQLAELGQRYHHTTGLTQGATGQPLPAPIAIAGLQKRKRRSRWPWWARICRACR
jgi:allophanate hydrolase